MSLKYYTLRDIFCTHRFASIYVLILNEFLNFLIPSTRSFLFLCLGTALIFLFLHNGNTPSLILPGTYFLIMLIDHTLIMRCHNVGIILRFQVISNYPIKKVATLILTKIKAPIL